MILIFIIIVVFGGFRYKVGADWEPYSMDFDEISSWDDLLNTRLEKLFCLLIIVTKKLGQSFLVFIPLFFTISFWIKYISFKSLSPNLFLSVLIYFYTAFMIYDINGIRQGMSLAITLFSLKYIIERKLVYFLICCLFAIGFHNSALFFVPAYWLFNVKLDLTRLKSIVIVILLIAIGIPLRDVIQNYTGAYLAADEMLSHYTVYMGNEYNVGASIITAGTIQRFAIFFIYVFSLSVNKGKNSEFELFLSKAYLIGIIIFMLFSFAMEYAARLSFCYKIMETLMIPIAIQKVSKEAKVIILSVVLFFAVFSIYQSLHLPHQGYLLPYQNQLVQLISF